MTTVMPRRAQTASSPRLTLWDWYAATGYDAIRSLLPYIELQQELVQAANPAAGEHLLIAGCGTGNFEWYATQCEPDLLVDGIDASPAMLTRARSKNSAHPNFRYHQADLCATLPFETASFDVAVMCNVLYALPDGPAALREIHRVLRPGGRFILCDRTPASDVKSIVHAHLRAMRALPPWQRLRAWLRTLVAAPPFLGVALANAKIQQRYRAGDYHYYAADDIQRLLTEIGFDAGVSRRVYADQCWLVHAMRRQTMNDG